MSKKNLELSKIALNILQKLIQMECVVSDSFLQVLSSIRELLPKADIIIQLKLVQILLELPNTKTWQVSEVFLKHTMYICLYLSRSKENSVKQTSIAALQRILTVTVEYCAHNYRLVHRNENNMTRSISETTSIESKDHDPDILDVKLSPRIISPPTNVEKELDSNTSSNTNINTSTDTTNKTHYGVFEHIFHDLCCLASPIAYYLNHSSLTNVPNSYYSPINDKSNTATVESPHGVNTDPMVPNSPPIQNLSTMTGMITTIEKEYIKSTIEEELYPDIIEDENDSDINPSILSPSFISPDHMHKKNLNKLGQGISEQTEDRSIVMVDMSVLLRYLKLLDINFKVDYMPVLEILETLIESTDFQELLHCESILKVLRLQLCRLVMEMIRKCSHFEEMMKVSRLTSILLQRHHPYLVLETDLILTELLRLLETSNHPQWSPMIVLETLRQLLRDDELLKFFYTYYDMNPQSDKRLFGTLIHALGRFLHQVTTRSMARDTNQWSARRLDRKSFTFVKDVKNPPLSNALFVSLTIACLMSFVEGLVVVCNVSEDTTNNSPLTNSAKSPTEIDTNRENEAEMEVKTETQTEIRSSDRITSNEKSQTTQEQKSTDRDTEIPTRMVEVTWRPLLSALSHMLQHSSHEQQYHHLLSIYQTLCRICGKMNMLKPLEVYLRSMSQHSLPMTFISMSFSDILTKYASLSSSNVDLMAVNTHVGSPHLPEGTNSLIKDETNMIQLSVKNVCTIHALVNISHGLGGILNGAWTVLLETFEKLDFIFHKLPWRLVNDKQEPVSIDSHWNDEVKMLDGRLQQLFESSVYLNDQALNSLLVALGHLSSSSLAGLATTMSDLGSSPSAQIQNPQSTDNTSLHNASAMEETLEKAKSFALRKFVETMKVNIYRLDTFWTDAYGHLHLVINNKYHPQLRKFGMSCLLQIQLKALTSVYGAHRENLEDTSQENLKEELDTKTESDPKKIISRESMKLPKQGKDTGVTTGMQDKVAFQKTLLAPYTKLFSSKYDDTREQVIKSVSELLEQCGQYITVGWPTIVELLHCVAETKVKLACLKLAFDDVRMIASDFLDCLPDYCMLGLIETIGLFGKQTVDNNVSFSSIGLLWRISDYITVLSKAQNQASEFKNKRRLEILAIGDGLQLKVYKELEHLCSDERSDVRNSALQTVHSAIVSYGPNLTIDSWIKCVDVLKSMLRKVVVDRVRLTAQQDEELRANLSLKEYRARKKKWNQSETHCLQGACRMIKMFILKLHRLHEFKEYWTFYLNTVVQLIDLNPDVASAGIVCLQDIAQSEQFINCCGKNVKYWNEMIECYRAMIHALANKELKKRKEEPALGSIFEALIESIRDLLNPSLPSRKLFTLQQIENILNTLEHLVSDNQFDPFLEPLETLDVRLTRLKNVLSIYEQLPPLSPNIAIPVISKIAGYLSYLQKCCISYAHHSSSISQPKKEGTKDSNIRTQNTPHPDIVALPLPKQPAKATKIFGLDLSPEALLQKIERNMSKVAQIAMQLVVTFYSIDIPTNLKVECFEMVMVGISKIINPFLCPIIVVTEAINGFEEVCKVGLPKFNESISQSMNETETEELIPSLLQSDESNNTIPQTTLRIWGVLGDIISITFRLQEEKSSSINLKENAMKIISATQQLYDVDKSIDLKLRLLEIVMKYILPFGHFAPSQLKQRIVLLLNSNCSSDIGDTSNIDPQRHTRVAQACISAMFELCEDTLRTRQKYDIELSSTAYSLLIPRIAEIFDHFIEDELKAQQPLPIYRQQEIIHILKLLKNLRVHPDLDETARERRCHDEACEKTKDSISNDTTKHGKTNSLSSGGGVGAGAGGMASGVLSLLWGNRSESSENHENNNNNNNNTTRNGNEMFHKNTSEKFDNNDTKTQNSSFDTDGRQKEHELNSKRKGLHLHYMGKLNYCGNTKTRPHLFRLYLILCRLVKVQDNTIKDCLYSVLENIGTEMELQ